MKTFSRIAITTLSMVGMAGVASAQQKAPAADKAAQPKAAPAPKAADKAPMMMPAPAEIAAMAKQLGGTWRCKGEEWDDKGAKTPMTSTGTAKLDLGGWWITDVMEAKGRMSFKMIMHTTYDPTSKKWRRLGIASDGMQMIGTSDGMKDNKMTWNLDMMGPMGAGQFREHMDMTDTKAGMKAWGEMSMDKGKTWMKVYEMTCKK
jgi:hypothetical protein